MMKKALRGWRICSDKLASGRHASDQASQAMRLGIISAAFGQWRSISVRGMMARLRAWEIAKARQDDEDGSTSAGVGGGLVGSCFGGWAGRARDRRMEKEEVVVREFVEARRTVILYKAADFAASLRYDHLLVPEWNINIYIHTYIHTLIHNIHTYIHTLIHTLVHHIHNIHTYIH